MQVDFTFRMMSMIGKCRRKEIVKFWHFTFHIPACVTSLCPQEQPWEVSVKPGRWKQTTMTWLLKCWYLFGFSWLSATNAMFLCQLRLSFRLVDVFYTMRWDPTTNMPFYLGFLKSVIRYRSQKVLTFSFQSMTISLVNFSRYDEDAETWHLTSSDGLVNGTSPGPINSMGTGLQTWQFDR